MTRVDGAAPRPPIGGPGARGAPVLLILPCNSCVRLGNYMLCSNWRTVWRSIWDLHLSGLVDLAAIDSCKPGIVLWGEESRLTWCDLHPGSDLYYRREPWRLDVLAARVLEDARRLLETYRHIVYYVNVKAYREALARASEKLPGRIHDAGPPRPSPLSYRSRESRAHLRRVLQRVASSPAAHS